jgi:tetratricopeptide (TPR) repeat protein
MNESDRIRDVLRRVYREKDRGSEAEGADARILDAASIAFQRASAGGQRSKQPWLWRCIMSNVKVRFGAVVAACAVALTVISLHDGSSRAWAVEDTIAAIEQIKTLEVAGKSLYGSDLVDFICWIRLADEERGGLRLRYESERQIVVVQGDSVYAYSPQRNRVVVHHGPGIADLKIWYKAVELSPWLTGEMLKTLQLFADDWKQVTERDSRTGRDAILITCSYRPAYSSFLLVVDSETKLIQSAKVWGNLTNEGTPRLHAEVLLYNQELSDELFEFEAPPGATVVDSKAIEDSRALFNRGEHLFHSEKEYEEAIPIYQQVYEKYPDLNIASTALMMIGLCHHWLDEPEHEIEAYEKAVREYPYRYGWIESVYFYLGSAHERQGQREKALEAYENCLIAGHGVRDPNQFPLSQARGRIEWIKSH